MVDKIWYDWQNKSPENKYAFAGGSVAASFNFTLFTQFPNGLPPFVNVSGFIRSRVIVTPNVCVFLPSSVCHPPSR